MQVDQPIKVVGTCRHIAANVTTPINEEGIITKIGDDSVWVRLEHGRPWKFRLRNGTYVKVQGPWNLRLENSA
jgi:hypothetical protein